MVVDNRRISAGAGGKDFDISGASTFNYARFFGDMWDSQRMQLGRHEVTWQEVHRPPVRAADVVLNLSCGVQTVPHLMVLQVALFARLGVDFVAVAGPAYCCGRAEGAEVHESKVDQREAVFVARYADAVQRCPCEGSCTAANPSDRP
jgi:hypothetical protein